MLDNQSVPSNVGQGFTGCLATRHPGQVPRFVMGYDKSWGASRDPEGAENIGNI